MAVNEQLFRRVLLSTEHRARPRIDWRLRGEPHSERALAYGFSAIGAFVFGGFGYLHNVLTAAGFLASVVVAFVAFVLSYRHMEGS